jgi:ribosomal protein S18 acetylase RimI-like enzyme
MVEIDVKCNCPVITRLCVEVEMIRQGVSTRLNEGKHVYIYSDKGYVVFDNKQLYWLAVKENDHGKGIGKKLVSFVEWKFKELGLKKIFLYTSQDDNEKAIEFYLKLGYVEESVSDEYYADGSTALRFGKKLE